MKSLIICTCMIFFLFSSLSSFAQQSGDSYSLERKVSNSDLVVEGQIITTKGFEPHKGQVYTSALIKITKVFKGIADDSVIEIVFVGGHSDSLVQIVSHGLNLKIGMEGVFFLSDNKDEIRLEKGLQSFHPLCGERSYIWYHEEMYMVAHHVATCKGTTYDDLEKDLFEPIEKITGIPRKVLGPNMFERKVNKTMPTGKN